MGLFGGDSTQKTVNKRRIFNEETTKIDTTGGNTLSAINSLADTAQTLSTKSLDAVRGAIQLNNKTVDKALEQSTSVSNKSLATAQQAQSESLDFAESAQETVEETSQQATQAVSNAGQAVVQAEGQRSQASRKFGQVLNDLVSNLPLIAGMISLAFFFRGN